MEIAPWRDLLQPVEAAGLIETALDIVGHLRPERRFIVPRDVPHQQNTPLLQVLRGETQAAKGDGHVHHIAALSEAPLGVPHRVEGRVEALPLGPHGIPLNAQGVGEKGKCLPLVVVGIQLDLHGLVAEHPLTGAHVGPHQFRRIIKGHEHRIEMGGVIAQVNMGALAGRLAIVGIALHKAGDHGHGIGHVTRRFHVEEILQSRRRFKPWDMDGVRPRQRGRDVAGAGSRQDACQQA